MNNVINLLGKKDSELRQVVWSFVTICLIVIAVMMNDSILKDERSSYLISDNPSNSPLNSERSTRAVASVQSNLQHQTKEWEQALVKKISEESFFTKTPLVTGRAASFEDQLRYGVLAGKYRVEKAPGNSELISNIEYVATNDVTDQPIFLDRESFLKDFKSLFSTSFVSFKIVDTEKSAGREVYQFFDSNKSAVGKISFEMDDEGRFISMRISL